MNMQCITMYQLPLFKNYKSLNKHEHCIHKQHSQANRCAVSMTVKQQLLKNVYDNHSHGSITVDHVIQVTEQQPGFFQ